MRGSRWALLPVSLLLVGLLAFSPTPAASPSSANPAARVSAAAGKALLAQPQPARDAAVSALEKTPLRQLAVPEREARILPRPAPLSVGLEVLVNDSPLRTIEYAGKTYLPVPRIGAEYEIRVWNHGPRRIAAILSVDGLSVINGKPASDSSPGYLVLPYSHIVIRGWRRNLETVAAFRFVDQESSYASLVGRPENIGVIGLLAIEEQVWRPRKGIEKKLDVPAAARLRGDVGSIGTEYGRELDSRAYYVPFVRSSNRRTITFYYDTREALRKAGVPVDHPLPIPFPGDGEFVPPPPGYKGK
jgi:hypothetical protein